MKKNIKILSVTTVALVVGVGGWWAIKESKDQDTLPVEEFVIKSDALSADIEKIDDGTRLEATADIYKASIENQYIDENGRLQTPEIDESLKVETQIEKYPLPLTTQEQSEPEMTELLKNLLSRSDGSTNEVKDASYRIVDEQTFSKWEEVFAEWVSGDLSEAELKTKWEKIQEPSSGLSKPTVLKYDFVHSESASKMMDGVFEAIEENEGSTAPHIAFVDVFFDKYESQYTLYYVESHIE